MVLLASTSATQFSIEQRVFELIDSDLRFLSPFCRFYVTMNPLTGSYVVSLIPENNRIVSSRASFWFLHQNLLPISKILLKHGVKHLKIYRPNVIGPESCLDFQTDLSEHFPSKPHPLLDVKLAFLYSIPAGQIIFFCSESKELLGRLESEKISFNQIPDSPVNLMRWKQSTQQFAPHHLCCSEAVIEWDENSAPKTLMGCASDLI